MFIQRSPRCRLASLCLTLFCVTAFQMVARAQESAQDSAHVGTLRAGAATANITPPLGGLIVGGFSPLPSDDVHDELHVRALVLTEGASKGSKSAIDEGADVDPEHTLAFIVCDNVGIAREVFDAAKKYVQAETGLLPQNLLMASTHTHSAVSARSTNAVVPTDELSDYQRFVSRRIADAVRIAIKRLAPAQIGWGSVDEPSELFNRRWFVEEEKERRNPFGGVDQVRMNPGGAATLIRPAGPTDPQISFISVQHADGRPLSVLANYSLHYVGGVPARTISADYFAVFARRLAAKLNVQDQVPAFVGILSNGTSGDVNNINFSNRGKSLPSFEKMERVGELVAQRVAEGLKNVSYRKSVSLAARASELTLAVRKPTAEMLSYAEKILTQPESAPRYHSLERAYAERVKLQAAAGDSIDVPLQVLRIGELGIAAIPFEVFTETGLEIKQRSPLKPTFVMELANGSYGYLPTPPQHELGGYETWLGTNKVEKEASTKIVTRLLEMFEAVKR